MLGCLRILARLRRRGLYATDRAGVGAERRSAGRVSPGKGAGPKDRLRGAPCLELELGLGGFEGGGMIMWHYICLVVGAVIGWVLCAICTVAKCDDCRAGRLDNGRN